MVMLSSRVWGFILTTSLISCSVTESTYNSEFARSNPSLHGLYAPIPGPRPGQCGNGALWYQRGTCDCPTGFSGETCLSFDCVHGVLDPVAKTCACHEGWAGVLCNLCLADTSCKLVRGKNNTGFCDSTLKVVKSKGYSCIDKDPILHALLHGTHAHVVVQIDRKPKNIEASFSLIRDERNNTDGSVKDPQSSLFGCRLTNCSEAYNPRDPDLTLEYECHNTTCAMSCETGSADCTDILKGIVEKVDGSTTVRCAANGACTVNEKVLDKLFRGGVHLQCSAGECVYEHHPHPTTTAIPTPTPNPEAKRQYHNSLLVVIVALSIAAVGCFCGLIACAVVWYRLRNTRSDTLFSSYETETDSESINRTGSDDSVSGIAKYLRDRGQLHGTLTWTDLTYSVKSTKPKETYEGCCGFVDTLTPSLLTTPYYKKTIHGISGIAKPGELTAVLGPSGSGKTTLLEALAGRLRNEEVCWEGRGLLEGSVRVGGRTIESNMRFMLGYVDQNDHLIGTLTPRESLMYSARLRLPDNLSDAVKTQVVMHVICSLNMSGFADSLIGTPMRRGISGGEKRRVSIGMELVSCPGVLFLDEPTSGLDSASAQVIISSLAKVAKEDDTVVCMSIHQPRSNISMQFDRVILLSKGYSLFQGGIDEALHFFESMGRIKYPGSYNPADYLIDCVALFEKQGTHHQTRIAGSPVDNESRPLLNNGDYCSPHSKTRLRSSSSQILGHAVSDHNECAWNIPNVGFVVEKYMASESHKQLHIDIIATLRDMGGSYQSSPNPTVQANRSTDDVLHIRPFSTNASWAMQFFVLSKRTLTNTVRDPQLLLGHIVVAAAVGLLLGSIYYHTGDRYDAHAPINDDTHREEVRNNIINKFINRMGSLLLMCAFLAFGSLSSLDLFYRERLVFVHESRNGFYQQSAFYVQRILFDFIPLRVIPPLILGTISYYMIGLRPGWVFLLAFLVVLVLINLCATTICMLIGLLVPLSVGNLMASMVILFSLMLTPIFNNKESMPQYLSWLHYTSFFNYGYEALAVNELDGVFLSGNVYGDVSADNINSTEILVKLGLQPTNYLFDLTVLVIAVVVLIGLGYHSLTRYSS
eukprot:CFRG3659T1